MPKAIEETITYPNGSELALEDTYLMVLNDAMDHLVREYLNSRDNAAAIKKRLGKQEAKIEASNNNVNEKLEQLYEKSGYTEASRHWNALSTALYMIGKGVTREKAEHPAHFAVQAKAMIVCEHVMAESINEGVTAFTIDICRATKVNQLPAVMYERSLRT